MAFCTTSDPLLSSNQLEANLLLRSTILSEPSAPLSPPWDDDDLMDFKLDESLGVDEDIEELLSCSPNSLRFESENEDLFSSLTSRVDSAQIDDPNISVCANCLEIIDLSKPTKHSCFNDDTLSDNDILIEEQKVEDNFLIDPLDPFCDMILENINILEDKTKENCLSALDSTDICEDFFGSESSGTDPSSSLSSCDTLFQQILENSSNGIYSEESDSPTNFSDIFSTSSLVSPDQCSVCKVCFQCPEQLKIHQEDFLKKNICCQCKKKLKNTSKLRNHWRKHNKEKPFHCNHCGKYYSQKNSLVRHQNLYCEVNKIKRSLPNQDVERRTNAALKVNNANTNYNNNIKIIAIKAISSIKGLDSPIQYQVQLSNKSSESLSSSVSLCQTRLKDHEIQPGKPEKSRIQGRENDFKESSFISMENKCKICNKDFHDVKSLENHNSMHQNRRSCCNCNKVMASKSKLMIHYRSHTKEFPFVCHVCAKSFAERTTLRKHISTHGEKQFHCDNCGKSFARKDYLTKHSLIHRQLFKCSQCTFQCNDAFEIEIHLSQH